MNRYRLYAITDSRLHEDMPLDIQVERAINGGATIIQLREKHMNRYVLRDNAVKVLNVCRRYGIPLIINDDVLLAKELDADGVHVGQSDMLAVEARKILGPDKIVGVTAKTVEQAQRAMRDGADYIGSGAVFGSTTKPDAVNMDIALLKQICESVSIPVVAIGGINYDNIDRLIGAKISGIAVVGGVFGTEDIEKSAMKMRQKIDKIIVQ